MKNLFNQIISRFFIKKVEKIAFQFVKEKNKFQSSKIPKYQIQAETIKNTKLLLNRELLLENLPKNGVVAELGVDKGDFSELILMTCNPQKLYLIDFWGTKRYNQDKRRAVEEKFQNEIQTGILEICLGMSTEVGKKFQDNYFDWIYIDTDHSYQTTINELEVWSSKIKEGGIISGHDFIIGNWDGLVRYGVIEAVHEFCSKYNWEILYLTMELDIHPSFAIRKI